MATTQEPLRVTYAKAVHDEKETARVLAVLNEHRTIMGREVEEFERRVAEYFGKKHGIMVNSGSSANLLAYELLDFPEGSEVITPLLTFSTTVAPIIKKRLVPVFADVEEGKYFINVEQVEKLISRKTRALMIPLLFGNVPNMEELARIAKKNNLVLIEDSCDTLGALYKKKPTGKYSDISTTSFYGSHIITAGGGGGMIMVNNAKWRDKLKILRGWGRTSSLFAESESLSKRFKIELDHIPYDAKFIFDEIAYNFLPTEIGAAFGNAQLDKLNKFKRAREDNFKKLLKFFEDYEEYFILPYQDEKVVTQWLAFPLTIRKNAPFTRLQLTTNLEKNNIQTRPIFTGNILRQPGFKKIPHKIIRGGDKITNDIMVGGFVIGCHHGMEKQHLDRLKEVFTEFLKKY